jgi:hypothetical protein
VADSAAERARRAYRHKRGDHSLCDPARRCELIEQAELMDAVAVRETLAAPVEGSRGEMLRSLLSEPSLGPLHLVLVEEAARIADRLDRLDLSLNRKGEWLRVERDDGGDVVVTVDSVLAESRQQAATLKALVAEIRTALPVKEPEKPEPKTGGLGDLSARIAARRGAAG